jgi:hypothetical protein
LKKESLNEELNRMKKLMNFVISENSHDVLSENVIKTVNRIDEQTFQKTVPDNVQVTGGRSGVTKKEFKKRQEEEQSKVAEGSPEELKKLFIEKFASDLGKRKAFKALPSTLKEDMMGAWLSEGGLPKDFWVNADSYKFQIFPAPKGVGPGVSMGMAGKEGVAFGNSLDATYQQYDKTNFASYNGQSANFNFIKTNPGTRTPLIKDNKPVGGAVTLEGYQMLVIAPGIGTGDDAKAMQSTTTPGGTSSMELKSPNIPLNFQTGVDNISANDRQNILNTLNDFLQNNPKLQKARQSGANIRISEVLVTSSASNSWAGNTLPFTHSNDGNAVGGGYDTSVQYAQDNLNLSNRRGNNLATLLQSDNQFTTSLNITPDTNITSQGIITDTGGAVDASRNQSTHPNRGQFASFTFKVEVTTEKPSKTGTSVKLNNFKVQLLKQPGSAGYGSRFDIHFSKAKYLKGGGKGFKSSAAISKNLGKSFRGFGGFLDSVLP